MEEDSSGGDEGVKDSDDDDRRKSERCSRLSVFFDEGAVGRSGGEDGSSVS